MGATRSQGGQRFLGAEWTQGGFLEALGSDRQLSAGKGRGEGWASRAVREQRTAGVEELGQHVGS